MTKSELRRQMNARLQEACPPTASQAVCERLWNLPEIAGAAGCALFAALPGEIDLTPLALRLQAAHRILAYPRFQAAQRGYEMAQVQDFRTDLVPGKFDIPEPRDACSTLPAERLARLVWIVPGLAFDSDGGRLGRGGGYYDRLLHGFRNIKVGVGRDWQLVESVPMTAHDVRMDLVVTDRRSVVGAADAGIMKGNT